MEMTSNHVLLPDCHSVKQMRCHFSDSGGRYGAWVNGFKVMMGNSPVCVQRHVTIYYWNFQKYH